MADRISLPPTPPGLQDQMYRGGGGPRPMDPPTPRQANTLVVGGPAYFTPEGYQAPIQPEQSFMPTNRAPDPIRDQFNRQLPPIQRPQPPMPAPQPQTPAPTPAPVQAPAPTQTGGVPEPEPYVPPVPAPTPSQGPDRGSAGPAPQEDTPNFLAFQQTPEYQDWVNSGGIGTMDMYTASDGRRFGSGTAGRMYDDYLASLGQADSNTSAPAPAPAPAPEPVFTPPPTTPEPNGFFPGVTPDFSNLDFSGLSDLNLEDMDFSNLPNYQMPAPTMPAPTMPAPQAQAPAPVYTPPPSQIPMQGMMDDYDFGNPNLRNMRGSDPRR